MRHNTETIRLYCWWGSLLEDVRHYVEPYVMCQHMKTGSKREIATSLADAPGYREGKALGNELRGQAPADGTQERLNYNNDQYVLI